jgi:hypothetical protein
MMGFNEQEFDALRNSIERKMESLYPGYRGPVYGVWTSGPADFTGFDKVVDTAPCALLF